MNDMNDVIVRYKCDRKECTKEVVILYTNKNSVEHWCLSHFMEMMEMENAYNWENYVQKAAEICTHTTEKYEQLKKDLDKKLNEKMFIEEMEDISYNIHEKLSKQMKEGKIVLDKIKCLLEKKDKGRKEKGKKKKNRNREEKKTKEKNDGKGN